MKKFCVIIVAMIMSTFSLVSCGQMVYLNNLKGDRNIETVYIGKSMLRLAGVSKLTSHGMGQIPRDAVKSVDALEVASTENINSIPKIRRTAEDLVKSKKMELLMEANEDDEYTAMYAVTDDSGDTITLLMILNVEKDEANLVLISGKISVSALAAASK